MLGVFFILSTIPDDIDPFIELSKRDSAVCLVNALADTRIAPPPLLDGIVHMTTLWGGCILAFLAGVRRGLSFRAPGGETAPRIATMLFLFLLALMALATNPGARHAGVRGLVIEG